MITEANDGGYAYPCAGLHGCNGSYGMTLRQWYAGLAMQGLLTGGYASMVTTKNIKDIKEVAFLMADAMLAEDYIQPWIKNPDMEVQNVPEVRKDES